MIRSALSFPMSGGNKLKTICSTKSWVALERLAISWNMIVLLNDFGGMPNLKVLQLNKNQLSALDDNALDGCSALEEADMSSNRLEGLPSTISNCHALKTINVASNEIKQLPDFSKCSDMEIFKVSSNKISSIDGVGIEHMKKLKTLFLDNNSINQLSNEKFGDGKGNLFSSVLNRVNIKGNPGLKAQCDASGLLKALEGQCSNLKGRFISD